MSRHSKSAVSGYRLLNEDTSECLFCGRPSVCTDLTPSHDIAHLYPEMEKVMAWVCRHCYSRIHYANRIRSDSSRRGGAAQGAMSFEDKRALLSGATTRLKADLRFVLAKNGYLMPSTAMIDGDRIFVNGYEWSMDDMRDMQAVMAMRSCGSPESMIEDVIDRLGLDADLVRRLLEM